jgi:hypothetical protein
MYEAGDDSVLPVDDGFGDGFDVGRAHLLIAPAVALSGTDRTEQPAARGGAEDLAARTGAMQQSAMGLPAF